MGKLEHNAAFSQLCSQRELNHSMHAIVKKRHLNTPDRSTQTKQQSQHYKFLRFLKPNHMHDQQPARAEFWLL